MRTGLARVAVVAALCGLSALAWSHVRLHNPSNKQPLYWSNPASISVVIQSAGSDDLDGSEEFAALRGAFRAWNELDGTTARLIENSSSAQQARTDWWADDLHLLLFDETNATGYFPPGSGIVALTPIWFTGQGRITDADVLFNGAGYQFTTTAEPGRFDVADIATHELGHLLGLDHSGSAGSTMYPYVDPSVVLHRSPACDDAVGLRDAYPESGASGALRGRVMRASNGAAVAGALVVALDPEGRQAGSALCGTNGLFEIDGLVPDAYRLYARPLDAPVAAHNLTAGWSIQTNFAASVLGLPFAVQAGNSTDVGNIEVPAEQEILLGTSSDPFPLRAPSGASTSFLLHGSQLLPDCTLACSDGAISVSVLAWWNGMVQFWLHVPPGHAPGNADLVVTASSGVAARLPGAVEIVPPAPVVSSVLPAAIDQAGGAVLLVEGSGFRPGAHVALGDRIYAEGEGLEWLDEYTLRVTTALTHLGLHDLVVVDAAGVEGRLVDAVQVAVLPSIESIFPIAGSAAGGTEILLQGDNYELGLQVRIDGQPADVIELLGEESVRVRTAPGKPGGPYLLELELPGGAVATGLFSYSTEADPVLAAIEPALGAAGTFVTVHGAHFTPDMTIVFGADEATGLGGVEAEGVSFVDEHTLVAYLPALSSGAKSVMVSDPEGQAVMWSAGFVVTAQDGGGGGGCAALIPPARRGPGGLREVLAGAWWVLALAAVGALKRGSRRTLGAGA